VFRRPAPHAQARRALIVDMEQNRRSWIQNGVAALAVSVLGLGVAGSVMLTGNATSTADQVPSTTVTRSAASTGQAAKVETTVAAGVKQPSAFQRKTDVTSRSSARPALSAASAQQAKDRATALGEADGSLTAAAQRKAAASRAKALKADAKDTRTKAEQLIDTRNEAAEAAARAAAQQGTSSTSTSTSTGTAGGSTDSSAPVTGDSSGASLPITSGFSIAARFGAVGSWSRYHTGIDFSAPIGTPIHAIAAGVITHAGPGGGAGGWAGNYVTIRHSDGTQTLYAHQSVVSVSVGQQVSAGTVIGHIGMTGRSFGPHVHVELYPQGVSPGDVYRAIDPAPWMRGKGLSV
jgi:murein DD-endopeptidase MepM/ murein hydrolase activator NlpD